MPGLGSGPNSPVAGGLREVYKDLKYSYAEQDATVSTTGTLTNIAATDNLNGDYIIFSTANSNNSSTSGAYITESPIGASVTGSDSVTPSAGHIVYNYMFPFGAMGRGKLANLTAYTQLKAVAPYEAKIAKVANLAIPVRQLGTENVDFFWNNNPSILKPTTGGVLNDYASATFNVSAGDYLCFWSLGWYANLFGGEWGYYYIDVDGSDQYNIYATSGTGWRFQSFNNIFGQQNSMGVFPITLTAGSHTFKYRVKVVNGNRTYFQKGKFLLIRQDVFEEVQINTRTSSFVTSAPHTSYSSIQNLTLNSTTGPYLMMATGGCYAGNLNYVPEFNFAYGVGSSYTGASDGRRYGLKHSLSFGPPSQFNLVKPALGTNLQIRMRNGASNNAVFYNIKDDGSSGAKAYLVAIKLRSRF